MAAATATAFPASDFRTAICPIQIRSRPIFRECQALVPSCGSHATSIPGSDQSQTSKLDGAVVKQDEPSCLRAADRRESNQKAEETEAQPALQLDRLKRDRDCEESASPLLIKKPRAASNPLLVDACNRAVVPSTSSYICESVVGSATLIDGITALLTAQTSKNPSGGAGRFTSFKSSPISVPAYMQRLEKHMRCSPECYVLAMFYLDKVVLRHPDYIISDLTVLRLIMTSLVVSAKYQDDVYCSNAFYAQVGGLSLTELNALEMLFIKLLNWELFVPVGEFQRHFEKLVAAADTSLSESIEPAK